VITGALLVRVLKMDAPQVRLACWRGLLAICLLLPLIQPWYPVEGGSVKVTQVSHFRRSDQARRGAV